MSSSDGARRTAAALVLVASAACGSGKASSQFAASPQSSAVEDSLRLSPGQQDAVDKIETRLYAATAPARAAERRLVLLLADGIMSGSVDDEKVGADVVDVANAAAAAHEATADAINQLHAVLTPAQRVALVDKVVAAHRGAWRRAGPDESAQDPFGADHLASIAKGLGLTPDQIGTIQSNLGPPKVPPPFDPEEVDTDMRTFAAAFEGDDFDARSVLHTRAASAQLAAWGAAHMAGFYEAVGPVLSPQQRTKLAQILAGGRDVELTRQRAAMALIRGTKQ